MAIYQLGSQSYGVYRIQEKLRHFGYYLGPLDGIFGGGTDGAVRDFQRENDLTVDGKVGVMTWGLLFNGGKPPKPEICKKNLEVRCLALTGVFETDKMVPECFAGLSGDFDGQGISFGALQWNFGQGSLQPLLKRMAERHGDVFDAVFNESAPVLRAVLTLKREEQLEWARSIQNVQHDRLYEPWQGQFKSLGRQEDFQIIQSEAAETFNRVAATWCKEYKVSSQRAHALMFDIRVQNGSIYSYVKSQIESDFESLPSSLTGKELEVAKLKIIANRRAEASNPRWVEDVRLRKLAIANGKGWVHGRYFELGEQYGITLDVA